MGRKALRAAALKWEHRFHAKAAECARLKQKVHRQGILLAAYREKEGPTNADEPGRSKA